MYRSRADAHADATEPSRLCAVSVAERWLSAAIPANTRLDVQRSSGAIHDSERKV